MFCKYCGTELIDGSLFCSKCGKKIFEDTHEIREVNNKETKKFVSVESSKSRLIAALLAFFFGDIGAHRFYVGKFFTGFLQLILGLASIVSFILAFVIGIEIAAIGFLVGIICGFWILIDFIMILCGSFKDKNGLPITDWGL